MEPHFAIINADTLGPAGFQVWLEVLGDFAWHQSHVKGATYDEKLLLDTIGQEPNRYIGALMNLLDVADHEQLHGHIAENPHAMVEHMLRTITGDEDAPVSRAQIILEMHAQLAAIFDAKRKAWTEA